METNPTSLPPVTSIDEKLREDGLQLPPWETPGAPVVPSSAPVNTTAFSERATFPLTTLAPAPEAEVAAPAPRKRGRPRKSETASSTPVAVAAPPRKRGRPRKVDGAQEAAPKRIERLKVKKEGTKVRQVKTKEQEKGKEERTAPCSGQSGPPLDIGYDGLNEHEKLVFGAFAAKGDRESHTIAELASTCFTKIRDEQANSWVRNSLRRLVRGGFLEKTGRGSYRQTEHGRREAKKLRPE